MKYTSWYRTSENIKLKNDSTIKIYRTVFETADYALSKKSVDWCRKHMDKTNIKLINIDMLKKFLKGRTK